MKKQMEEQLIDLQTRFAFQEDSLQALSDVIARQQQQIDQLEETVALCRDRLAEMIDVVDTLTAAGAPAHELPPHY